METLTIEIDKELKQALLQYSSTKNESPNVVVSKALREFLAFSQHHEKELWFGISANRYFALSEKGRQALWDRAYQEQLDKPEFKKIEVSPNVVIPEQKNIESIRQKLCEPRKPGGSWQGKVKIADDFDELPEDLMAAFGMEKNETVT